MIKVIFYNRDFSHSIALPSNIKISVERYSWNMQGGPDKAYIRIETSGDNWELTKLLRCPVEIYDIDGRLNWWGYVNKLTVPYGDLLVGLGLDGMSNYVAAKYDQLDAGASSPTASQTTAYASDAQSVQEYGQKENILSVGAATAAQATGARDTYLANNKFAPPELDLSGGNTKYVKVECYGWFQTLDWKYYANAGTSATATTTQISAIVTGTGQFFRGSLIENASGIDSNQYRDGTKTGLACVKQLLDAGTSNNRPLLTLADKDRYLHVYERGAEDPEYLLLKDGNLETLLGQRVRASHCLCAKWVRVKDIPDALGGMSAMRNFFIESAEYNVDQDRCIYRPAGSFEPLRLPKSLGLNTSDRSFTPAGGFASTLPYHTHAASAGASAYYVTPTTDVFAFNSGVTLSSSTNSGTSSYTYFFTVTDAGFYIINSSFRGTLRTGTGTAQNRVYITSGGRETDGFTVSEAGSSSSDLVDNYCSATAIYHVQASGSIEIGTSMSQLTGTATLTVENTHIGIFKLGTKST